MLTTNTYDGCQMVLVSQPRSYEVMSYMPAPL